MLAEQACMHGQLRRHAACQPCQAWLSLHALASHEQPWFEIAQPLSTESYYGPPACLSCRFASRLLELYTTYHQELSDEIATADREVRWEGEAAAQNLLVCVCHI